MWYTARVNQPLHPRKHVVIIGSGFAGLAAALELERLRRPDDQYNVTLIDRNCYHLYHALLYEVATAAMDIQETDLAALQGGVSIRVKALAHILLKKRINAVQGTVNAIDLERRRVDLVNDSPIFYDQLIIALGSVMNYFGIPGLAEHSQSFKDLPDALGIHLRVDRLLRTVIHDRRPVRIIVGGGGVSGVEIAGELKHYANHLSRRHGFDRRLINVEILEAGTRILNGLGSWAQQQATGRLARLGVTITLGQPIAKVDEGAVHLRDGTARGYDLLIWCGGIQAPELLRRLNIERAGKSQAVVDDYLRLPNRPEVAVSGDCAYVLDHSTQRPCPQVAPLAVAEGRAVADNLYRSFHQRELRRFRPLHAGFVIPIGGLWAISTIGFRASGWFGWLMRKREDLKYFLSILTWPDALHVFFQGGKVYLKNT